MDQIIRPSLFTSLDDETPLQIVGVTNPLVALMAKQVGFNAIYLSGAGIANANYGLPDLAMTNLTQVVQAISAITDVVDTPLLVDADTGFGGPLNAHQTARAFSRAGASGLHIEDQDFNKRCGHRDGKRCISSQDMVAKINACVQGRMDESFMVIARTDALAVEGQDKALERAKAYQQAGADALFLEAVTDLSTYQVFSQALDIPILANMTEFGKTPLALMKELETVGVSMILHPLSVFRAMNHAALSALSHLREHGDAMALLDQMQTREELYNTIHYHQFEQQLDDYISAGEDS